MAAHILIVEDEPSMAAFLAECLEDLGYGVEYAADGLEALQRIRQQPPALILLDIMLPGMGGWELVRRLRAGQLAQGIPIVVCTARRERPPSGDLVQGVLYKPFRVDDIRRLVRGALPG